MQEADSGKSRSWRRNVSRLNLSVSRLEEDMEKLEKIFPQVSAPGAAHWYASMQVHPERAGARLSALLRG